MARIRTVKPEFFKHYELFAAEKESKLPLRLGFQGLWICADKEGRFKWRPSALKLDILPYDECDFDDVLIELAIGGFIVKYIAAGKEYGFIPSFRDHQRITGSEVTSESRIPDPRSGITLEALRKHLGNTLDEKKVPKGNITNSLPIGNTKETPRKRQGNTLDDWKGREGKGKEIEGKGNVFNQKPVSTDFNGLPEINLGTASQLIKITQKVEISTDDLNGLWEIFKIQNLTGEKFYQTENDVYSHFLNWIKGQKINKDGNQFKTTTPAGNGKRGTSEARIDALKKW